MFEAVVVVEKRDVNLQKGTSRPHQSVAGLGRARRTCVKETDIVNCSRTDNRRSNAVVGASKMTERWRGVRV